MKRLNFLWATLALTAFFSGCGRPPSGGGGPPEGDFPMNVVGAPVTVTTLRERIQLVGSFEAPDEVTVVSEVQGEVVEIGVGEGQTVESGHVLARIDDGKFRARLREARARLDLAESNFARAERLKETDGISEQAYDEARVAVEEQKAVIQQLEEDLEDTRVTAPMAGRLGEILVSRGQVVTPGQQLMELVQTDPLEIRFEVPEQYLGALDMGLTVSITTDAYGDETFEGEVTYLAPRLRQTTRTLPVKARVPNPDKRLKPGMLGNVDLVLDEIDDALVVPESALSQQGASTFVIVRNDQFRAEMRKVEVGNRMAGKVHIRDGLAPDDVVVAEGVIKAFPGVLLNFTEDSRRYGLEPSMAPTPAPSPGSEETGPEA